MYFVYQNSLNIEFYGVPILKILYFFFLKPLHSSNKDPKIVSL